MVTVAAFDTFHFNVVVAPVMINGGLDVK